MKNKFNSLRAKMFADHIFHMVKVNIDQKKEVLIIRQWGKERPAGQIRPTEVFCPARGEDISI